MQNETTLTDLGFRKNFFGEWFFRGKQHTFSARVIDYNGPVVYVELFKVTKKVDMRPLSDRKGRHYQSRIKDCMSAGSVERAITANDI